MRVDEILKLEKTLSFEFFPPSDEKSFTLLIETVEKLKRFKPDFISVTDSRVFAKTKHLALAKFFKEKLCLNPVIHLTCINNTQIEIKNMIAEIEDIRIENILALRGDKRNFVNYSAYYRHATDLIKEIDHKKFCILVAAHPETGNLNKEIYYLKMKKELGASVAITQIFFSNDVFLNFRDKLKKECNIFLIPGIITITSKEMFSNIIKKTGKIKIPVELKKIIDKDLDKKEFLKYSIDFTINQVNDLLKNGVDGLHFFTFNKAYSVEKVMESILR